MKVVANNGKVNGAVLPMLAIGLLGILGTVGLAIDLGHGFTNKTRLQNALDAAALSGARTLMLTNKNTGFASSHARQAFTEHLAGEMSELDATNLVVQFSMTLKPFNVSVNNANFIRVRFDNFETGFSFSSVLPGIGDSMSVGGTAVAGPIPVGTGDGELCDVAPILMCGANNDSDCSDGECFGYAVGIEECHILKNGSDGNGDNGGNGGSSGRCIEDDDGIGPGNFQLARLYCPGGACVRQALAGAYGSCMTSSTHVETEPGNTVGPTSQGINTRFGIYHGAGLNASDYPPDIVTTSADDYWYEDYQDDVTNALLGGNSSGVPYRRVLTVPVVDCDGDNNGQSTLPTLGFACFFLLEPVAQGGQSSEIFGQLVEGCEGSGTPGTNPGSQDPSNGPYEIILYKDPDVAAS